MDNLWLRAMMGVVVGDALGMPVQFVDRENLKLHPITTMTGYGTYRMPPGTWSDDSSMALATLASLKEKRYVDLDDIMGRFVDWLYNGAYTPYGKSFDMGQTCFRAISNYKRIKDCMKCGVTGEYANGNGALMRIMPVCIYSYELTKRGLFSEKEAVLLIHHVGALTHNHIRSCMACGIYYFLIVAILEENGDLNSRLQIGMKKAVRFYQKDLLNYAECSCYSRLFDLTEFASVEESQIKSSGYVVDTLEAAVWCLLSTDSFEKCLLKAVNLGDDADTVGAIAGGLAGLYYGLEAIPYDWIECIVKKEEIEEECKAMQRVIELL